jgi:hypothetical protein
MALCIFFINLAYKFGNLHTEWHRYNKVLIEVIDTVTTQDWGEYYG